MSTEVAILEQLPARHAGVHLVIAHSKLAAHAGRKLQCAAALAGVRVCDERWMQQVCGACWIAARVCQGAGGFIPLQAACLAPDFLADEHV